ncbi:MAG TPA: TIGR02266 family protein [Kofleriaceae bacterium]|nr:TIGR02266 family protein [Kofleriaceae bacterium]
MGPKAAKGHVGSAGTIADAERRRATRVLVDLEVDYASEENYLFAYITDISATGIFVRTTTPEQPGTHLNLRFQLPPPEHVRRPTDSETKIEVEGEVIWVNPYRPGAPDNLHPGMGIRFVGLDEEVRDQLIDLIRRFAYLS